MRKLYAIVLDVVELYLPAVTFSIMFVVFILQIVYRYALNSPLKWTYEVTVFGFIWTTLLGACYMRRLHRHINFNMFYNARTPATQMAFRLIGNGIIFLSCALGFFPTLNYLSFLSMDKSAVLRIPLSLGFSPVLVFLLLIGLHSLEDIIDDVRKLFSMRGRTA
jgi:TRAP-type C4-dicarboxylate transport system permease small subunit